ncbi:MAG: hypothetical protein EA396_04520 [Anaerolineaceae bacterium]|nr:MAG: hypothetical protein EA396_04520 [Anaerolineaceae bacterium]
MDNRTRTRLLLLVAFVIIVAAVGLVLLIGTGDSDDEEEPSPAVELVQEDEEEPAETAVPTDPAATAIPTQELRLIAVAVQNISRGATIPPEAVELRPWPFDALPFSHITDIDDIAGRIARVDILSEQPVLSSYLVDSLDQLSAVGSDAAAILPPGTVAISLPMDRLTSVAYALQQGDSVDIIVSLLFVDLDEEFQSALPNQVSLISAAFGGDSEQASSLNLTLGDNISGRFDTRRVPIPFLELGAGSVRVSTSLLDYPVAILPSEAPRPRLLTHRTILDAQVVWVGDFPTDGRLFEEVASPTPVVPADAQQQQQQQQAAEFPTPQPPRPDIVTLAVTPQEAAIVTWLLEARVPITFALRGAADRSRQPSDPVTIDYIIAEYDITVPRRNDYAIEPAIRSIRELIAGQRITLGSGD